MIVRDPAATSTDGAAARRLAEVVGNRYGREVRSVERIARGMGTTNWLVRTPGAVYFLKQYPANADRPGEAAALELSQSARVAGVPAPRVVPTATGDLLASEGDLALALFEYLPDTTSGVPLSRSQMAQAGHMLGRLHHCLRERSGLRDISAAWLALDERRKRAAFERYLQVIESREAPNDFDRRTARLLPPAAGAAAASRRSPRVVASAGATRSARRLQPVERPLSRGRSRSCRRLPPARDVLARLTSPVT